MTIKPINVRRERYSDRSAHGAGQRTGRDGYILVRTYLAEELRRLAACPAGIGEPLGLEHGDVNRPMKQDLRHYRSLRPPRALANSERSLMVVWITGLDGYGLREDRRMMYGH